MASRTRASADQRRLAGVNNAHRPLLVPVDVRDARRDDLPHVQTKNPLVDQLSDCRSLAKPAGEADVWPTQQRCAAHLVHRKQLAHLRVQARIGKWIRRELVLQKAPDDLLGVVVVAIC